MSIVLAASLVALQGVTLVEGPQADSSGLAAEYGSGVCRISVFGKDNDGERIRAEVSNRLRDGNLALRMTGPFVSKFRGEDNETNHPMTVKFDSGTSAPSRSGGYNTGSFREYVWGGWGAGEASDVMYEGFADASSFTVEIDGNSYGPFTWEGKGAVYNAMEKCSDDNS
ncbi:hypothetical protein [Pontixanthobacter sp. CEM42]|uniref:hypothetical protein n=1 Tax=Pontixanthobacter sp. CEM42 TaxID=2792077 RepID=UPI001AE0B62B|nr:hypothetical protein [Pontixanthobacter sp. CEM42]